MYAPAKGAVKRASCSRPRPKLLAWDCAADEALNQRAVQRGLCLCDLQACSRLQQTKATQSLKDQTGGWLAVM